MFIDQDQGRGPALKGKGSWPSHGRTTSCTVHPGLADLRMADRVEVAETNQWPLFKVEEGIKPFNDHWSEATGKTFCVDESWHDPSCRIKLVFLGLNLLPD